MVIISEMEQQKPSTLPFTASFDPSNPLGLLEKVLDFIGKQSNFLKKATAEKEIAVAVATAKKKLKEAENKKRKLEKEKESVKPMEKQESGPTPIVPNKGNGLDLEKYSWTQNLQEVTINIPVPNGTKSRSVICEIKKNRFKIGLQGEQEPIIDGEFFNSVKPDDCFWNIEDQKLISVLLTKQDQMEWWKYCVKGEPEIDTQKVEPESSRLGDLDLELRQSVDKMMFDKRAKKLGLPTSGEIEQQDMLKKFMSQHPNMDFSNVKFN